MARSVGETVSIFTLAEVAKHDKAEDCWLVVDGNVLDVTAFLGVHPGGRRALMWAAGTDATVQFNGAHPSTSEARRRMNEFCIGRTPTLLLGKTAAATPCQ